MSRRNMTHRERWLSTVCDLRTDGLPVRLGESIAGAPRQPGAFRTIMALLSMYADNDTGANARPSLRLLQSISHYKYATVHGALGIAQKAGYITATGTWTPPKGGDPIIVWALGYPTPDGFQPWCMGQSVTPLDGTTDGEPVSPLDGTTDGDSTGRNHRQESVTPLDGTTDSDAAHGVGDSTGRNVGDSVGRNVGESTGRSTTSSTSRPQGSEGEEVEALRAPTPDGSARTRLTSEQAAAVANVITAIIPAVAQTGIDCGNADLGKALADAAAAGWDQQRMAAVLADMKTAKKSPTGQAITRIRELASKDPAAILIASDPATAATAAKVAATPPRDPLADENQNLVAKFCKWSGAERQSLSAALAEFQSRGLRVEPTLRDEDPIIHIIDPDLDDYLWLVSWSTNRGVDKFGEPDDYSWVSVTFGVFSDEHPPTDDEADALDALAREVHSEWEDNGIVAEGSVTALRRLVDVSHPVIRGAYERLSGKPHKPSRDTVERLPRHLEEWLDYLPTLGHDPEPARQALREAEQLANLSTCRMFSDSAPIGYTTALGPKAEAEVRWTARKDGRTTLEVVGDDLQPLLGFPQRGQLLEGFRYLHGDSPPRQRITSDGKPVGPEMLPQALQLLAKVAEREASA